MASIVRVNSPALMSVSTCTFCQLPGGDGGAGGSAFGTLLRTRRTRCASGSLTASIPTPR
jgi:hypothetical protein